MPPREEALRMAVCGASHVSGAAWHVQPTRPNFPVRHYSVLPAVGPFLFSFFSPFMRHATCAFDFRLLFVDATPVYSHLYTISALN
jgi:hypothetical protein